MATSPPSENPQAAAFHATQVAIAAELSATLADLWPDLVPNELAASFEALRPEVAAIGSQFAAASASLAVDYYEELRAASGVRDPFRVPIVEPPGLGRMSAYLNATTADLLAASARQVDDLFNAELTLLVQQEAEASLAALVADTSREQIIEAGRADRRATKWARVTRAGACSFCRLLASRGAVYRFENAANFRAHTAVNGRGGTCQCTVEPQFGQYEPTAQARADADVYKQVTRDGFTGDAARNEFRRRLEGRADGPRRSARTTPRSKAPVQPEQPLGFDNLTPAQLQKQLDVLERLPASDYRTRQTERVRKRLADLAKQ